MRLLWFAMLLLWFCYVLLCFAMLLLCFAMCRYVFDMFCYVIAMRLLCFATFCDMLRVLLSLDKVIIIRWYLIKGAYRHQCREHIDFTVFCCVFTCVLLVLSLYFLHAFVFLQFFSSAVYFFVFVFTVLKLFIVFHSRFTTFPQLLLQASAVFCTFSAVYCVCSQCVYCVLQ